MMLGREFFQPWHLILLVVVTLGCATGGLLPFWIARSRRSEHRKPIALVAVVGCLTFSLQGAIVWTIALIWACYDKPALPVEIAAPSGD